MPFKRVPPQQDGDFDLRHCVKQGPPPVQRAFGARRGIAARPASGKAETHGDYGDFRGIVKDIFSYAQPCSKPLPAGIVKRPPLGVRNTARRLPGNQDACCGGGLNDRLWPKRQIIANRAFANALDQLVDGFSRDGQPCGARS